MTDWWTLTSRQLKPAGRPARRLWPWPLSFALLYKTAEQHGMWEKEVLAQSRCYPQWVRGYKRDETDRQTAGMDGRCGKTTRRTYHTSLLFPDMWMKRHVKGVNNSHTKTNNRPTIILLQSTSNASLFNEYSPVPHSSFIITHIGEHCPFSSVFFCRIFGTKTTQSSKYRCRCTQILSAIIMKTIKNEGYLYYTDLSSIVCSPKPFVF